MNKRDFKRKHKDFLTRYYFANYVNWLNLYKREKRQIREQKEGKYNKRIFFIGITEYYIKWWREQLNKK